MQISQSSTSQRSGVTLVEMLISIGLIIMVLAVVLSGHLYGLRLYSLCRSKLQASQASRDMVKYLISEVYSAANVYVANSYSDPFHAITNVGALRQGNALQIWLDASNYVCYYFDADNASLHRAVMGSTNINFLGDSILVSGTNHIFTLRDYAGQILTNETGNVSVHIRLEFQGTNYPTGQKIDYNKFETTISRRSSFSS